MNETRIDILLAAYNGEQFLKEQIDSILNQTYKDWRLLIRDDGSTDGTIQIIKSYAAKYPDKIRLVEDNLGNLGVGQNFGRLLELCQAEYIMFCDQDDVWLPGKLEKTFSKMKETEKLYPDTPILVFSDLKIVDENLKVIADSLHSYHKIDPIKESLLKNLIFHSFVTGSTIMMNKKLRDISIPIPQFSRMHDWWVALNAANSGKIFYIHAATVLYRQHPKNVVGSKKTAMTPSVFILKLKRFFRDFGKDCKTARQFSPNTSTIKFLLKQIQFSIQRRI